MRLFTTKEKTVRADCPSYGKSESPHFGWGSLTGDRADKFSTNSLSFILLFSKILKWHKTKANLSYIPLSSKISIASDIILHFHNMGFEFLPDSEIFVLGIIYTFHLLVEEFRRTHGMHVLYPDMY